MAAGRPPLAQADPIHCVPRAAAGQYAAHRRRYVWLGSAIHPISVYDTGSLAPRPLHPAQVLRSRPWHWVPNTLSSSSRAPGASIPSPAAGPYISSWAACPPHPTYPTLSEQLCPPKRLKNTLCRERNKNPSLNTSPSRPYSWELQLVGSFSWRSGQTL